MKKSLIAAITISSIASIAHADVNVVGNDHTDVSVYGVLDVGVAQLTNAGNFGPNITGTNPTGSNAPFGTVRGMVNGAVSQTRWGIKGSEEMGGGNKAFFQLESAFSLPNGNISASGLAGGGGASNRSMISDTAINGQLFNRMAFVGIANTDWGALTFGRQNSLQLDIITSVGGGYDPVNAQIFSPINFSGTYGGGGATDNSRVDSAIKYAKKIGNLNVSALYGMGGMANASSARSNGQLNVGYETGVFGVQLGLQQANDTTAMSANAAPNTVNAVFEKVQSYMLAGRYQVTDGLTLKAGYEREQISAPSNYGADALMTTLYSYNIGTNKSFANQRNLNVYWLGANYQVTPALKASVGFYDVVTAAGTEAASGAAVTTIDGADKYYSAMLEYYLSKQTNLYAAMMLDRKSGSMVSSNGIGIANFNTYGVGLRVKF
ncbi:MAG: porin [Gallionella sp.]